MMKKFLQQTLFTRMLFFMLVLLLHYSAIAQLPAFPGAEGFGKFATGGRTGTVYRVTNLNNTGAGSLRDAVSQPNRIVVFDVAGVIRITSRIVVSNNIYIAGQTAPGEGITVYGNGWSFSNAHNTICRYIRIRMGAVGDSGKDAVGIADGKNMIFDHCSISWGRDETFSINSSTSENITIQNTIMSQGLMTHSAGGLMQAPGGITLYRNLYVDNQTRNNKIKGINQYVNNLVYNWTSGAYIMGGDSQGESFANAIGNVFIQGPGNGTRPFSVGNSLYHIYENDNLHDNNRNGAFDPYVIPQNEFGGGPDFLATPYNYPALPTVAANTLLTNLLPTVGASLPYRDLADYYVVNEVKSLGLRGEFIAKEDVLPFGVPTNWNLWGGNARTDTDGDGMPDNWETANGLNPGLASDAMQIAANGYTNIENYINGIGAADSQDFLRAPLSLKRDAATQTSLYLSWLDYTEKETGYIIERKVGGVFVEIGRTAANVNTYEVSGLQPEESGVYRVRAFNGSTESANSNELTAKTRPVEVPVIDPDNFVPDLTWTGATNQVWDLATQNWVNATNVASLFTNNSKLLFGEAGTSGQTIQLPSTVTPGDILFKSDGSYTITGAGVLGGTSSVNKTGTGNLVLPLGSTYSGATVLHNGVIQFGQLANGGQPSAIGASLNYGFNWVWKGGTWNYTGGNATTDRQAIIDKSTTFSVEQAGTTVTLNGELSGVGGLIKEGPGRLSLRAVNPYEGETVIKGGVLEVYPLSTGTETENLIHNGVALGTSNIIKFEGGTLTSRGGSDAFYETYPMSFQIKEGTENTFAPQRTANLKMDVSGSGILNYDISYSRELIQGDWSGFTGKLVANGIGTLTNGERSMLMIDNGAGLPNTLVNATGNTKITTYSNNQTLYLGGLSGTSGTTLASGDKNAGGTATWVVGGANTNETFAGVINNEAYGSSSAQGTTHIVKEGEGIWRLTNTNPYNGTTTIETGVLVVNGNKSGSGAVTVNEGVLAGTGSLSGNITVVAGAIEPGDSSVGTLTLRNNVTLETGAKVNIDINKSNGTWDKINITNTINYNGVLNLQVTGTLVSGDEFKIFTAGGYAGNFTAIQPAEPGPGLQWRFTPATGVLEVVEPGFVKAPSGLSAVTGLNTTPAVSAYVTLSWQDNSENELHFVMERSADGTNFTAIGQPVTDATTYTDNTVADNTKYYYRMKAVGDVKESIYSAIVEITTPSLTATPDQAGSPVPAQLTENVVLNNGKANLQWSGSANTVTYSVYVGTVSGSLTKLSDLAYSATASLETAVLQPNTVYYWRVDASNANGTTIGVEWQFKTSAIPFVQNGDYRSRQSGGWADASSWETYDGENWNAATGVPGGSSNVTIRGGHTVTIAGTTTVRNLVIENNGTFKSSGSQRNIRVTGSVLNYGTFGSSSSSSERVNLNPYLANGEVYIGGTNILYVNEFRVHSIAQVTNVFIDVDMSIASYFRAIFEPNTNGVDQDDDDITVTINPGKSVNMINGSNSYFHQVSSGSTNTNNTLGSFGKYTYNILGTLNMGAVTSATSCIIAHTSKANSKVTVNVEGTWITPAAMRIVSAATTVPAGGIEYNISGNGLVNAATRSTNLVQQNTTSGVIVPWNITDNGALRISIAANATATYHTAAGGLYSPVRIKSNDAANTVNVGVANEITPPLVNGEAVVKNQYNISPVNAGANLEISLGWLTGSQGALFNPAGNVLIGHHDGSTWDYTAATVSGAGTVASPYYATASGFTAFSPFIVTNQQVALPARLLSFEGAKKDKDVLLQWVTAEEINVKDFTIERSTDGNHFNAVGTVTAVVRPGAANSYQFTNVNPAVEMAYYRLKINDNDGSFRYSKIIIIRVGARTKLISVAPNPAYRQLTVKHAAANSNTTITIISITGQLVHTEKIAAGNTQTTIPVNSLIAGLYTLVWNDGSQQTIKFMKN
jgi:autotransporter-associated beta strand protein